MVQFVHPRKCAPDAIYPHCDEPEARISAVVWHWNTHTHTHTHTHIKKTQRERERERERGPFYKSYFSEKMRKQD